MNETLFYAFTMIAFLGGIAIWDGLATRQEIKRDSGPSIPRSDEDD